MTVNKDAIEKWATALETGKYDQVDGKLYDGKAYCCLGVLCEVAVEEGVIEPAVLVDNGCPCDGCKDDQEYRYDGANLTLPRSVAEWAFGQYASTNPSLKTGADFDDVLNDEEPATGLNDEFGWSFTSIAAAVRKTFLEGDDVSNPSTHNGEVPNLASA